jgi:hypothetical protein
MVRIGSSTCCPVSDWINGNCHPRDPHQLHCLSRRCLTGADREASDKLGGVFAQEGLNPNASIGVMEVAHKLVAFFGKLRIQR